MFFLKNSLFSVAVPGINSDIYQSLSFDSETGKEAISKQERASKQAMGCFFAGVEKRAYRMARIATNNSDDAFDIVQDAMFKLAEKYSNKTQQEWGGLFHCILQSRILDWHRRSKVRNRFRVWFGHSEQAEGDAEQDWIQTAEDVSGRSPEELLQTDSEMSSLERLLHKLPLRQQQAFLLRAWEGLSVKETAAAMGCSQGSVKTHYSRAKHFLRTELKEAYHGGK